MKISFLTLWNGPAENVGYGVAGDGAMAALERMGHSVSFADPDAPVEIAFCQPGSWQWSNKNAHHIGYVPWESTRIPASWPEQMRTADEIWTTSPWVQNVFERSGVPVTRVYEHGVDAGVWQRKLRGPKERPLRFLHIGEPAPRKAGQLTYDTFVDLFAGDKRATLTIKAYQQNTVRGPEAFSLDLDGSLYITPTEDRPTNVKLITRDMPEFELADLVRRHDVLVYPSWGEGFGLIPLQAMVTGMPTICTANWAPYRHLLVPELALRSRLARSPWPDVDPGNMYEPDAKHLRDIMEKLIDPDYYRAMAVQAYAKSFDVEMTYDWDKLTAEAFSDVIEKFS